MNKKNKFDLNFNSTQGFPIGVEVECQILDPSTGGLVPGAIPLLKACEKEKISGVSAEFMQSMIEIKTGVFRGGCLTGPNHSGAQLHGFLAYLLKCAITGSHYTIFGYKGKQVRDNIHSYDLVNMFWHFYQNPRQGEVYNAGGGRHANCSMLEAIELCEQIIIYLIIKDLYYFRK